MIKEFKLETRDKQKIVSTILDYLETVEVEHFDISLRTDTLLNKTHKLFIKEVHDED